MSLVVTKDLSPISLGAVGPLQSVAPARRDEALEIPAVKVETAPADYLRQASADVRGLRQAVASSEDNELTDPLKKVQFAKLCKSLQIDPDSDAGENLKSLLDILPKDRNLPEDLEAIGKRVGTAVFNKIVKKCLKFIAAGSTERGDQHDFRVDQVRDLIERMAILDQEEKTSDRDFGLEYPLEFVDRHLQALPEGIYYNREARNR